jgi:hypothetical protein
MIIFGMMIESFTKLLWDHIQRVQKCILCRRIICVLSQNGTMHAEFRRAHVLQMDATMVFLLSMILKLSSEIGTNLIQIQQNPKQN